LRGKFGGENIKIYIKILRGVKEGQSPSSEKSCPFKGELKRGEASL
jgi:hypothetical protein